MVRFAVVAMLMGGLARADAPKKPGKGFWRVLVKPNQKWVLKERELPDVKSESKPATMVITTYDVRKIGDADVARLKWRVDDDDSDALQMTHAVPLTQIAVTDAGAYLFYASADDAKIAEALKGKPSRSDPPKPYKATKLNEGRFLTVEDGLVCMGYEPRPDDPPCEEVCGGSVCIDAVEGFVSIDGNWSPFYRDFAAPNSKALAAANAAWKKRTKKH